MTSRRSCTSRSPKELWATRDLAVVWGLGGERNGSLRAPPVDGVLTVHRPRGPTGGQGLRSDFRMTLQGLLQRLQSGGPISLPTGEWESVEGNFEDLEAARRFVEDRMETYERMWDGCGCRIDYHA